MGEKEQVEEYDYAINEYEESECDKMKFEWNINDKSKIKKLILSDDKIKNSLSFHSDVFYGMFQLKVAKNQKNQWLIHLCGLPKFTTSIGAKWDIMTGTIKDKIKIFSQIITFSYDMAVYELPTETSKVLTKMLEKNKCVSIWCKVNIVQKKKAPKSVTKPPYTRHQPTWTPPPF